MELKETRMEKRIVRRFVSLPRATYAKVSLATIVLIYTGTFVSVSGPLEREGRNFDDEGKRKEGSGGRDFVNLWKYST